MKIGVIILTRAKFGRWPDKVLFTLQGVTILEHVIRKSKTLNVDTVIVSTTENQEDQIIRNIAWDQGVEISSGEPDDRTARICKAITEYNLDYVVSLTACQPFFDVEYANILIGALHKNPDRDIYGITYHSNNCVPGIFKATLPFQSNQNDQEIYCGEFNTSYKHWQFWEPEVRNRYLFDCNIAYKIQADNHRRICEHLGHFPENYEEVTKALLTIE